DDGNRGRSLVGPQAAERGDAVEIRQLDVHQDQRRVPLAGESESVRGVAGFDGLEAVDLQQVADELQVPLVVLDDQDQRVVALRVAHDVLAGVNLRTSDNSAARSTSPFRAIDAIRPRRRRSSSMVTVFDVRTTIGMELVAGFARSWSTTMNPSTCGIR